LQQQRQRSLSPSPLSIGLLIIALAGPILHLAAIAQRGVALLYADPRRLMVAYALLALSAAAAAYVSLGRGQLALRIMAGIALLVNLGSVAYVGTAWSHEMRLAFTDLELTQIETGKVGIVVCPADDSTETAEAARALEEAISNLVALADLDTYIVVRHASVVRSAVQARELGSSMRANVVVWAERDRRTATVPQYHIAVLGANETEIALEPYNLMLLLLTQGTLTVSDNAVSLSSQTKQIASSLAAGFGFLAIGQPLQAAGQFQYLLERPDMPQDLFPALHTYLGTSMLFADRPDLAAPAYTAANAIKPTSAAWAGLGLVALQGRDWRGAEYAFNQAVAIDPYGPTGYCGQGIILAHERNVSRALSAYRQAIALDKTGNVPHALMGLAFELEANVPGARDAYRRAALYAGPNVGLQIAVTERADKVVRNPPTAIPTATPIPIPTHTPIPTQALYRVERGDTLQLIAEEFDVEMQRIVDLNKLGDPNALVIGQLLQIPQPPEE
jgi:tetratricopeptide (TPR) repeat protein